MRLAGPAVVWRIFLRNEFLYCVSTHLAGVQDYKKDKQYCYNFFSTILLFIYFERGDWPVRINKDHQTQINRAYKYQKMNFFITFLKISGHRLLHQWQFLRMVTAQLTLLT